MTFSELLSSIITGIISGIVASTLFYIIISKLRPRISLSEEICRTRYNGKIIYGIKMINNSNFSLLDLKAELVLMSPFTAPGGLNYNVDTIPLRKSELAHCNKYDKKDAQGSYAIIFVTTSDIDEIWKSENQILRFKVYGKHSFSGFTKSFEKHYYTKRTCIKEGIFNFGKNFAIQ